MSEWIYISAHKVMTKKYWGPIFGWHTMLQSDVDERALWVQNVNDEHVSRHIYRTNITRYKFYLWVGNVGDDLYRTFHLMFKTPELYCTYHTHSEITRVSITFMTTCTACTVITIIFYSWVPNVYEEMYCTYRTPYEITLVFQETCTACKVFTTKFSL